MLSHEIEERLAELLVDRIEEANSMILNKIGENIKLFSAISVSEAYQLAQILKYGGSYREIVNYLSKVSGKNVKDIYKIFEEVATQNKEFAKKFYKYRNIDFIPYSKDLALQSQADALAKLTSGAYLNLTNTTAIGYIMKDMNGNRIFRNIEQVYQETIDRAVISISQGKTTFYQEMRNTLKEIGQSGLVQYDSGVTRRLDSAVRMNILDGIKQLNMETSSRFGKEYGADGVEITVHENPAPDHADIQGRQFSNKSINGEETDWQKIQKGKKAKDINGVYRQLGHSKKGDYREIGELNCYHYPLNIVLGVSKPQYTDKQLKEINKKNEEGFYYEGKHYTLYEGTQLQRRIETEVRRQKDTQILAKASGDKDLVAESQENIKLLTRKYKELCNVSGLKPKNNRMVVSGYKRIDINKL